MQKTQPPTRRIAPCLHQIRVHNSKQRIRAAMEYDPIHIAQDLKRRCLECRLADALAEGIWVVSEHASRRDIAALELVHDEGG